METRKRSLVKALSWRFVAAIVTGIIGFFITGNIKLAASIGIADTLFKLLIFYWHERAWNKIHYGRSKPPEYQI